MKIEWHYTSPTDSAGTVNRSYTLKSIFKFLKSFTFFYLGWKEGYSMTGSPGKLKN